MPGDLTGAIETLTDSNAKSCFRNALEILHGTCSRLGESHKRVLALRFLECHLIASRRPVLAECHAVHSTTRAAEDALSCVSRLETVHFQLFTSFVVHTDVICQHVAHSIFQDRSELAARQLLGAAAQASHGLQNITAGLSGIIRDQESVVKAQSVVVESVTSTAKALKDHHERLKVSISRLAGATDSAFSRVDSKLARIDGTLDAVLYLERALNSYADTVNQVAFYACALAMLWVVTSDVRVSAARPGAVAAAAACLLAERMCWSMAGAAARSTAPAPDSVIAIVGIECHVLDAIFGVRVFYASFLALWVLWSGCTYRDHAKAALDKLEHLEHWISGLLVRFSLTTSHEQTQQEESDANEGESVDDDDHADPGGVDTAESSSPEGSDPESEEQPESGRKAKKCAPRASSTRRTRRKKR